MKYRKGESGNPAGKPKGTLSKTTKLRALLEPHAEELITTAVSLAKSGDSAALRLCLERIIPAFKTEGRPVVLPDLLANDTPADQGRAVLNAIAGGVITLDEGSGLMAAISTLTKVIEADELERRIAALEVNRK